MADDSMYRSQVIYYGPPGLESDVFEKAMTNLGFWVDREDDLGGLSGAVKSHPGAIMVIATRWTNRDLHELLNEIRSWRADGQAPIFVIGSGETIETKPDHVRFVPASQRLRGTINGIGEYVRNLARGRSSVGAQA